MHVRHQIKRTQSHCLSAKSPFDIWESRLESSWPSFCRGETLATFSQRLTLALSATVRGSGVDVLYERMCVCVFEDMCWGVKEYVSVCGCAVTWRIDANRGQITQGFARIQYIMKGLYVESNMPQFSGSSWRLKPWETAANELINGTTVTFMSDHHVVKFPSQSRPFFE